MSLDKAIQYGKEKRKPYHGGKSWDKDCRNHGACEICYSNRTHSTRKRTQRMEYAIKEVLEFPFWDGSKS